MKGGVKGLRLRFGMLHGYVGVIEVRIGMLYGDIGMFCGYTIGSS